MSEKEIVRLQFYFGVSWTLGRVMVSLFWVKSSYSVLLRSNLDSRYCNGFFVLVQEFLFSSTSEFPGL